MFEDLIITHYEDGNKINPLGLTCAEIFKDPTKVFKSCAEMIDYQDGLYNLIDDDDDDDDDDETIAKLFGQDASDRFNLYYQYLYRVEDMKMLKEQQNVLQSRIDALQEKINQFSINYLKEQEII